MERLKQLSSEVAYPKVDPRRVEELVKEYEPQTVKYASILAGGSCSADCYFCIGRDLRAGESAHTGPDWRGFLSAVSGRTEPYMSLSGLNSDPTLIKDVNEIILESQRAGYSVALHTNGFSQRQEPYGLSDKITISYHSFHPERFERIIRKPGWVHKLATDNIERWGPTGRLKLSVTYLPENQEEVKSGEYFKRATDFGIKRVVVRKFTEWDHFPELPQNAVQTREFYGQRVYDVDGVEVTTWDYFLANMLLPALYYWPNGSVEKSCAWEDIVKHA